MFNIDLNMKNIVAGGRSIQSTIIPKYIDITNTYAINAIGMYIAFIVIPTKYPMKEKSLCHGRKKFLRSREKLRLSSTINDILDNILKCHIGILIYHHTRNSLKEYVRIRR